MPHYDRRAFMASFSALGLGATLLPGLLWAQAAQGVELTVEVIASAEKLAGLTFTPEQREMMLRGLQNQQQQVAGLRAIPLPNAVPPAIHFDPVPPGRSRPAMTTAPERGRMTRSPVPRRAVPSNLEELSFLPVTALADLVRRRQVTSVQLTEMYLRRLERYDPALRCVVTLTPERAIRQAREADAEIARGRWRGPLHGIPWGAKDLLAVAGHPTTWGTTPYRAQTFDEDAEVVKRLDAAGAVLVAKLTLGELAQGDTWFGGRTNNPWNLEQGSSGSSAGSASATAAGLVGFAIGTETLGSISSPSTRCGTTGLRPTFGRVPRTGAMALSWTMDKIGAICRSVEDCALVFDAIHGTDGLDRSVVDAPFTWNATTPLRSIRIGYVQGAFERESPQQPFDQAVLDTMRRLGVALVPVEIPDMNYGAMRMILTAEAAAFFDDLTRSGRDAEMAQQGANAWPNSFRTARFIPAVEYINANRARTLAMEQWARLFETVDVIIAPTSGPQLTATNLTGHPAVILPNGFRENGTPVSITFLAGLYDEARLLVVASAYQRATEFHLRHPPLG
ncbi:MAG TPA: amidase [Gemmatimonadaceae bacterium]|nr:amidase [Gemmatimonadaceae bacterium]